MKGLCEGLVRRACAKGLCEGLVRRACGCLMLLDFGPFGSWIQVQFKAPVLKAGCLQLFIAEYEGQG